MESEKKPEVGGAPQERRKKKARRMQGLSSVRREFIPFLERNSRFARLEVADANGLVFAKLLVRRSREDRRTVIESLSILNPDTDEFTTIEDPAVSLFPAPPRAYRRVETLDAWIYRIARFNIRNCTFTAYEIPPPDLETESMIPSAAEAPDEEIPEETAVQEPQLSQPKKKKAAKKTRKQEPKKKTKAEVSEARRKADERDYLVEMRNFLASARRIQESRGEATGSDFMDASQGIADFLNMRPHFKPRFLQTVRTDPAYHDIYLFMSLFYGSPFVALKAPKVARAFDARFAQRMNHAKAMTRLANELFSKAGAADPTRANETMTSHYRTDRSLMDYADCLFFEYDTFEFLHQTQRRHNERWLEIGPGPTYREPLSFMNLMRLLNPSITIVGADPLYSGEGASLADRALGRNRLDGAWASQHELIGDTAQELSLESESVDEAVSLWTFDKFNEETGGTPQALRQVARVLKPGSLFRVYPLAGLGLEEPVLKEYFDVMDVRTLQQPKQFGGLTLIGAVLKKKELTSSEKRKLERDTKDWIIRHSLDRDDADT